MKYKFTDPRIYGGVEPEPHSLNFQVFLKINLTFVPRYCGGSIISSKYVLTAAHCVQDVSSKRIIVVVGEHNIKIVGDEESELTVADIFIHPNFSYPNLGNFLWYFNFYCMSKFNCSLVSL